MSSQNMTHRAFAVVNQAVSLRPAAGTVVNQTNVPAGVVCLVDTSMKVLAAMPASGQVAFVYSVGSQKPLIKTQFMDASKLTLTKQKFQAAVEQVTTIGYAGSGTGNMPVVNSADFGIYIRQEQEDNMFGGNCSHWLPMVGQFSTSATSSAKEFAMRAADAIWASAKGWKQEITNARPSYCRIEVITNGTPVAIAQTASPVTDSAEVTFSAAPAGLVAGDLFTLGGTDTYEVKSISGAVVTMTTKYRGATASGVAAAEVTATATLFGIKFTGIANEFDRIMWKDYTKNTFDVFVTRESAPVDLGKVTTPAKNGVGTWEFASLEELDSMYATSQGTLAGFIPNQEPPKYVVDGSKYSIIDVKYQNDVTSQVIGYAGQTYGHVRFLLELGPLNTLVAGSQGDQLAETILTTGYTTGDLDA
jgi:hypothetical protein